MSVRRAAKLVKISRSVLKYKSRTERNEKLCEEIKALAAKRVSWGAGQIYLKLRMRGWKVNHKRVERIYREEKLSLRRKKKKKLPAMLRVSYGRPEKINESWAADFMSDALISGRKIRIFNVVDEFSTEALAIEVGFSLPATKVTAILDEVAAIRGYPERIRTDNGPEFVSAHFQSWCEEHGVHHNPIEPGKPYQNPICESFNGRFRAECLDQHLFLSVTDARNKSDTFKDDYNNERPKRALGGIPPRLFAELNRELINQKTMHTGWI